LNFDSGRPVPGYTGFKAPAQGDFCRLVAGNGFDPQHHPALDIGVEINRRCPAILRLLQRQRGFGRGNLSANTLHNGVRLALEGSKFGIRARMKVAARRASPPRPAPLVATPVHFSNIIVLFFEGEGREGAGLTGPWPAQLRLAATPRQARHRCADQRRRVGRGEGGFVHAGNYTAGLTKGDKFVSGWCKAMRGLKKGRAAGVG